MEYGLEFGMALGMACGMERRFSVYSRPLKREYFHWAISGSCIFFIHFFTWLHDMIFDVAQVSGTNARAFR